MTIGIPEFLPTAVRAFQERLGTTRKGKPKRNRPHSQGPDTAERSRPAALWPRAFLAFDCETTVDAAQRLTFGSYRYGQWSDEGAPVTAEEGLVYADGLPVLDPAGFAELEQYAKTRTVDIASGFSKRLRLLSRAEFVRAVFYPVAYEMEGLVVGFNLPFDLSRLATASGEARGWYRGGFSFRLTDWQNPRTGDLENDRYRPRVCIKHIDSKRAFIGFAQPARGAAPGGGTQRVRGRFLDLKTLAFALTSQGHSLASACKAFGVVHGKLATAQHGHITPEYIDYNRRDVLASVELLGVLRKELDRHPVALDPCCTYSPASVAKAYLKATGLVPPATKFRDTVSAEVLGRAMSAYFGGRAESKIRRTPVPVVHTDFTSMYPTVNALMGNWGLLTARGLTVVHDVARAQALLMRVTVDACFDPRLWRELHFFALVELDDHVVPVRAQYGEHSDAYNIGVNRATTARGGAVWLAGPDLVAAVLLSRRVPHVLDAFYLVPQGRQAGLKPVALRGAVVVHPARQDLFRTIIEERKRVASRTDLPVEERERLNAFLKVLANSGSYGIFAEVNPEELRTDERAEVRVYGTGEPFEARTRRPEEPGSFCFPPLAALITAGARLMLALLEGCVTDLGGTYAFCDTDSMAIVATRDGGLVLCPGGKADPEDRLEAIRALSWEQVQSIVDRFQTLNPYDRAAVPGSVLRLEDANFVDGRLEGLNVFCISAKRYVLFRWEGEGVAIVKCSEHGLGHLMNPAAPGTEGRLWIKQLWEYVIRTELGLSAREPEWFDRPAISRVTISSPALLRPLARAQEVRAYSDAIKPFNFILSAHVAAFGHPIGADPERFHLLAPFTTDASRWLCREWTDSHSGERYHITTSALGATALVHVKSLRDVVELYRTHPESKSAAGHGPCGRSTAGLLLRRHVLLVAPDHIGKESTRVEEVEAGLVHSWDDVVRGMRNEELSETELAVLFGSTASALARESGLSERAVRAARNGRARIAPPLRAALLRLMQQDSSVIGRQA